MNVIARRVRSDVPSARYIGEILVTRCEPQIRPEWFALIYAEIATNRA
jgi:hypothetical protein